ncbi:MAG: tol-pal system protein YbgF [Pseudomonadota bacterium]
MNTVKLTVISVIALGLLSGCVAEQDVAVLENRIARLEMDSAQRVSKEKASEQQYGGALDRVEETLASTVKESGEKFAGIQVELDEIRNTIAVLNGRIDETDHKLSQYSQDAFKDEKITLQRLDSAVSKNYQRLLDLENYMGFEPSDSPKPGLTPAAAVQPGTDTSEKGIYDAGKQLLDQGDNEKARLKFEEFLKLYPTSENADNAAFWVADTYYRDKWFEKAILEYQKVIEKYAKGNKVPGALLKQGYSFANLGEKANARLILKELIKKYPGSNEARIATDKLKALQ